MRMDWLFVIGYRLFSCCLIGRIRFKYFIPVDDVSFEGLSLLFWQANDPK
jgi:hypothetical protein